MNAFQVIVRKLLLTVAVLLMMIFCYSIMFQVSGRTTLSTRAAVPGMNVEQEDAGLNGFDDSGNVLDSIPIDYAA